MTTSVMTTGVELRSAADKALTLAARFWFVVAVAGRWMFAYYVAAFYRGGVRARFAMAAVLVILTLAMGLGIGVAAMAMWLPRI